MSQSAGTPIAGDAPMDRLEDLSHMDHTPTSALVLAAMQVAQSEVRVSPPDDRKYKKQGCSYRPRGFAGAVLAGTLIPDAPRFAGAWISGITWHEHVREVFVDFMIVDQKDDPVFTLPTD